MYDKITIPDINYVVQTLRQFMQIPKRSHLEGAYMVVRYLKCSVGQGIWLKAQNNIDLVYWYDSD